MRTDIYIVAEVNQVRNMNLRKCKIGNLKLKMQEILKYLESLSYQAFAYVLWQGNARIGIKDLQMPKTRQKESLHSYYIFCHNFHLL